MLRHSIFAPAIGAAERGKPDRRSILHLAVLAVSAVLLPVAIASAQEDHGSGGGGGHDSGKGGGDSGGGEGGESGRHGAGRNAQQRAYRHRQRTGRTLGGGATGGEGGHTGHDPTTSDPSVDSSAGSAPGATANSSLDDPLGSGEIGGATGGEHFTHQGAGYWGADGKVLRR